MAGFNLDANTNLSIGQDTIDSLGSSGVNTSGTNSAVNAGSINLIDLAVTVGV